MMRRLCLLCLVSVLLADLGCSSKPKPNPAIATDVEEGFKTRWIAKRMSELQASGAAPDAREARRRAVEEFRKRFEYTTAAQRGDPVGGESP